MFQYRLDAQTYQYHAAHDRCLVFQKKSDPSAETMRDQTDHKGDRKDQKTGKIRTDRKGLQSDAGA